MGIAALHSVADSQQKEQLEQIDRKVKLAEDRCPGSGNCSGSGEVEEVAIVFPIHWVVADGLVHTSSGRKYQIRSTKELGSPPCGASFRVESLITCRARSVGQPPLTARAY
jgi:hypothetical protein